MSDALPFTLEFPEADVRDLFRQMDMHVRHLRRHENHALNIAGKSVAQALGTSTRVAPKYRQITENKIIGTSRRNVKAYDVTGYFGRPRRLQTRTVFAQSKMNAKRRHAAIRRRGLGKMVWSAIGRKFGGIAGEHTLSGMANEIAGLANKHSRVSRGDGYVQMTNRLGYAAKALQGGPQDVSTAMERAARSMQRSFENQLVRRMGLGRLSR